MADQKGTLDENLIPGDMVEFLWTDWTDGEMYLWGQVEDVKDGGKQLTAAVYDDPTEAFDDDIPLFRVKWNEVKGRYEGKMHR